MILIYNVHEIHYFQNEDYFQFVFDYLVPKRKAVNDFIDCYIKQLRLNFHNLLHKNL